MLVLKLHFDLLINRDLFFFESSVPRCYVKTSRKGNLLSNRLFINILIISQKKDHKKINSIFFFVSFRDVRYLSSFKREFREYFRL